MRWNEITEDNMPTDLPSRKDVENATIAKRLAHAKRLGIRLPGEPSDVWGKVTPEEIIRLAREVDSVPCNDTVIIPANSSIEEIVALLLKKPNA